MVAAANVVAFADLPYGYFQLLRIIVTGYCAWVAYGQFVRNGAAFGWTFAAVAILYNPLFKIHLERDVHEVLNLITAALVVIEQWLWLRREAVDRD